MQSAPVLKAWARTWAFPPIKRSEWVVVVPLVLPGVAHNPSLEKHSETQSEVVLAVETVVLVEDHHF